MPKIKLTKNELRRQKEDLKRFEQYLPTLLLKKQQLQTEILKIYRKIEDLKKEKAYNKATTYKWVDVFAEDVGIRGLVKIKEVGMDTGNIAGVDIPIFREVVFDEQTYNLFTTPLWVDHGIEALKKVIIENARMEILNRQLELIKEELRTTTQRVNLFEKVKIPEAKESIRKIQIYLGDMQTAAVVRGKIAKEKIQQKRQ